MVGSPQSPPQIRDRTQDRAQQEAARTVRRLVECPVRRPASCGLVDIRLGHVIPMGLDVCDRCWESDPMSEAGASVRESFVRLTVRRMALSTNVDGLPDRIREEAVRVLTDPELEASRALPRSPERPGRAGVQVVKWLGIRWRGPTPYPVQVWRWLMRVPKPWGVGCGCAHVPKSIVERVLGWIRSR